MPRSACTAVSPLPWTRVDVAQLEHVLGHRIDLPVAWSGAGVAAGGAARHAADARVSQWSSQRTSASAWKIIDSRTSSHAASATVVGLRLQAGEVLQRAQRRGALRLHDRVDVDARRRERQRELDRELVARAALALDRRGEPARDLVATGVRERGR